MTAVCGVVLQTICMNLYNVQSIAIYIIPESLTTFMPSINDHCFHQYVANFLLNKRATKAGGIGGCDAKTGAPCRKEGMELQDGEAPWSSGRALALDAARPRSNPRLGGENY